MRDSAALRTYFPAAILAVIVAAGAALRFAASGYGYNHPDEHIPERVALTILKSGIWDTNWARAGMQEYQAPQYNFSGYILSVAALLKFLHSLPGIEAPSTQAVLRLYSMALGTGAIALTFLLARRLFGGPAGMIAALLVCVSPLLYQDSLYPRPEAFVTFLTLVYGLLILAPSPSKTRVFAGALTAGFLIATKISLVVFLPWLFLASNASPPPGRLAAGAIDYVKRCLICLKNRAVPAALGCAAGFLAGAPYAVFDIAGYMEGLAFLQSQYARGHWPHGLADGTTFERLDYAARYFVYTGGIAIFTLTAIAAAAAVRARNYLALALLFSAAAIVIRFSTYAVFFERNISHAWPIVLMGAAYGAVRVHALLPLGRAWVRAAALLLMAAATAAPEVRTTRTILDEEIKGGHSRRLDGLRASLAHTFLAQTVTLSWNPDAFSRRGFDPCRPVLIDVAWPSHHPPGGEAAERAEGYTRVAYLPSAFPGAPTSTLDVYFLPGTLFVYRDVQPAACTAGDSLAVSRRYIGDPLPVMNLDLDVGWEPGHLPPEVRPAFLHDRSFSSWSQADEHLGRALMEVETGTETKIVLGYVTGLNAKGQSLEVRDAATQRVIWERKPLAPSPAWTFEVIALPRGTSRILVEAMDGGTVWSEWLAVETPRKLTRDLSH